MVKRHKFSNYVSGAASPRAILKYTRVFLVGTMTRGGTAGRTEWGSRMLTVLQYKGQLRMMNCPSQNANSIPIRNDRNTGRERV